jgi:DNA-binding MarR family transcriptional regulator
MIVRDRMDFFDALMRYETLLWSTVERDLSHAGAVGLGTLQGLRVIQRFAPRARVHEVSRELGITIGAASKFVDRLERDGLAVRTPHPTDRRSSLLTLTEIGERARSAGEDVLATSLAPTLSGADLDEIMPLLRTLQSRLETVHEGSRA